MLTTATIGAVLSWERATPASAAPPRTESGTYASLSRQTSDCVTQGARTMCTDIAPDVFSGPFSADACLSRPGLAGHPGAGKKALLLFPWV